jgi:hypothetical protein
MFTTFLHHPNLIPITLGVEHATNLARLAEFLAGVTLPGFCWAAI